MNAESNTISSTVTLVLETGEKFEEVPVHNEGHTMGEFLDETLKALEVSI